MNQIDNADDACPIEIVSNDDRQFITSLRTARNDQEELGNMFKQIDILKMVH